MQTNDSDARFCKRQLEKRIGATTQQTANQKTAILYVKTRFRKHQLETQVASLHIKTNHSPCKRSIPQAPVRDMHLRHHIKTSQCRKNPQLTYSTKGACEIATLPFAIAQTPSAAPQC